jgi:hypothetical protein
MNYALALVDLETAILVLVNRVNTSVE